MIRFIGSLLKEIAGYRGAGSGLKNIKKAAYPRGAAAFFQKRESVIEKYLTAVL
jgi:hypothetical protein